VVNDDIISTYDLAQRMRLLIAQTGIQPTEQTLPQYQQEALVALVDEHLQLQELKRVQKDQKFDALPSDKEIDEQFDDMARQGNMTRAQLLASLQQQGVDVAAFRQQLSVQIGWQRYISARYGSRVRVGDDQIKAVQQRLTAAASKPQYQISEVFIDAGRVGGMQVAQQGAQQLVSQLQQGAPFAAVARQFSASATAASGGEVGWVSPGEMAPEVDAALDQLRPGQLSQPITTKDGVYIVYLRDKRAGAGAALVSLKQLAIGLPTTATPAEVDAARAKLEGLRGKIKSCADVETAAAGVDGVVPGDLGEAEVDELAPQFKDAAQALQVGQVSSPIRTAVGLHLVAVCGRRASGAQQTDRADIENRLYSQQLTMLSRRYMRDLRTSATIETK